MYFRSMQTIELKRKLLLFLPGAMIAVPVLVGIVVFVAWLITRNTWLLTVGWWVILAGVVAIALGILSIAIYVFKNYRSLSLRSVLWAFSPLFFSALIGVLCVVSIDRMITRVEVVVANNSEYTLTNLLLYDTSVTEKYQAVAPNSRRYIYFYPNAEGPLYGRLDVGHQTRDFLVSGYMTINGGSDAVIIVDPTGEVSIDRK